jgi:hypothetical protein
VANIGAEADIERQKLANQGNLGVARIDAKSRTNVADIKANMYKELAKIEQQQQQQLGSAPGYSMGDLLNIPNDQDLIGMALESLTQGESIAQQGQGQTQSAPPEKKKRIASPFDDTDDLMSIGY